MAREVRTFQPVIPAGTPSTAPVTLSLAFPTRLVRSVRIRVPRGASGLMGFRLASGGQQIIPWLPGSWLIMDDEVDEMPLEGQIDTGAWQLIGYNTGVYAHTVYLRFLLDPVQLAGGSYPGGVYVPSDGGSVGGSDTPTPPPDDGTPPPPSDATTYPEGYAAGRLAALVALQTAFGLPATATAPAAPAAGTLAAGGWTDALQAAGTAVAGITADAAVPVPPTTDGAATARRNALAAVRIAFGITGGPGPVPAPLPSDVARAAYDATKAAELAAVRGIRPT